jgi:DNA-binding CsgD family transcriptional regulator
VDGVSGLTLKQDDVFKLLRQGQTNKLIARQLGMSEATVKVHVRQIIRKFGVSTCTSPSTTMIAKRIDAGAIPRSLRNPAVLASPFQRAAVKGLNVKR